MKSMQTYQWFACATHAKHFIYIDDAHFLNSTKSMDDDYMMHCMYNNKVISWDECKTIPNVISIVSSACIGFVALTESGEIILIIDYYNICNVRYNDCLQSILNKVQLNNQKIVQISIKNRITYLYSSDKTLYFLMYEDTPEFYGYRPSIHYKNYYEENDINEPYLIENVDKYYLLESYYNNWMLFYIVDNDLYFKDEIIYTETDIKVMNVVSIGDYILIILSNGRVVGKYLKSLTLHSKPYYQTFHNVDPLKLCNVKDIIEVGLTILILFMNDNVIVIDANYKTKYSKTSQFNYTKVGSAIHSDKIERLYNYDGVQSIGILNTEYYILHFDLRVEFSKRERARHYIPNSMYFYHVENTDALICIDSNNMIRSLSIDKLFNTESNLTVRNYLVGNYI